MVTRMLEPPEQSVLAAALIARMQTVLEDWSAYESDPGTYWADIMAAEMIARIGDFNASARQSWLLSATGGALEDLVAQYGITRRADESDNALRVRAVAQFASRAVGTPDAVRVDARAADARVDSVSYRPDRASNEIDVWITRIPTEDMPNDIAPPADLRTVVQTYLNADERKLIWIDYSVLAPTVTPYTVDGTITYARGTQSPRAAVEQSLNAWMRTQRALDTRVSVSGLVAACWVPGVVDVDLTSPAADMARAIDTAYVGAVGSLVYAAEA